MILNERQRKIFEILKKDKSVSNKELMKKLFVSESTLRRDLTVLEKHGVIYRTHGNASLIESSSLESSIHIREKTMVKEKHSIALRCTDYLSKNEAYFFDSSSTAGYVLPYLDNLQNITVITNSLNNALILTQKTSVRVYIPCGIIYRNTNSVLGIDAINYIKNFNCNAFIFSCGGISINEGITEASLEQSLVKNEMLNHSKLHILLVDHTKFGRINMCKTCDFDKIDYLITDKVPSSEYLQEFEKAGVKVVIA